MRKLSLLILILIFFSPIFKVKADIISIDSKSKSKVLNEIEKRIENLIKDKDYILNNTLNNDLRNKNAENLQLSLDTIGKLKDTMESETNSSDFNKDLDSMNIQFKTARLLVAKIRETEIVFLLKDFISSLKMFINKVNEGVSNKSNSVENINSITKNLNKSIKTLQDEEIINNELIKDLDDDRPFTLEQIDKIRTSVREEMRKYKAALVNLHKISVLIS